MFRKIVATFLVLLLCMGLLAAGGLTFRTFGQKIELKNPLEIYSPLVHKLGINFDINVTPDSGGSILVDAEDKEKPNSSNNTDNSNDNKESDKTNSDKNKPSLPNLPSINTPDIHLPSLDGQSNQSNKQENDITEVEINTKELLKELISTIKVINDKDLRTNYDRNLFESPVKTYELNGKKYSRNDYAWMTSEYLISEDPFEYECPYTGMTIEDESRLDYDHIIPLKYVYTHSDWDKEKCNEYAYAQDVGVDVYYSANRSKSDKGPSEWLPNVNIENYCYTWLVIASEWDISLSQKDIDVCYLYCLNAINSGLELERID